MDKKDANEDAMYELAKKIQQDFYELLPEWTVYEEADYKYLKQNIAYALYGPPTSYEDCGNSEKNGTVVCTQTELGSGSEITTSLKYKPQAQKHIDTLYNKIYKYGNGYNDSTSVCFAIIYNVIYHPNVSSKSKKESVEKTQEETSEEEKPLTEKAEDNMENKKEENDEFAVLPIPIFKVKKFVKKEKEENTSDITYIHDILYIDITGRVYSSWPDYINGNKLHECTMVLPKNGFYEPDPDYEITEIKSVVWLEVTSSPACNVLTKVLGAADTTSSAAGFIGFGVAVASVFTPVAPAVLTAAAVASAVNCAWTAGRSTGNLVDRGMHDESINVGDPNAFSAWLGLTGSILGATASGGSYFLSKAAQNGKDIGKVIQYGYNTILLAGVGVNGIGIGYQVYSMYEGYKRGEPINKIDVLLLTTHILFFGSTVINLTLAGELIESSQGKVVQEYRDSLRSKRLRKAFNKVKRKAAKNNTNKISENAEVISYINRRKDFQAQISANKTSSVTKNFKFEDHKIKYNGIVILDPLEYTARLLRLGIFNPLDDQENNSSEQVNNDNVNGDTMAELRFALSSLLEEFYLKRVGPITKKLPCVYDFETLLEDIQNRDEPTVILKGIFMIAMKMIQNCNSLADYLFEAVCFIWCFVKFCARASPLSIRDPKARAICSRIVIAIQELIETVLVNLLPAFKTYLESNL